jgi:hypothetical protein
VPIQRAKPIDDLYEEVADHDLVLAADAPLTLALSRRLDEPRLGRFAATPRTLASGDPRAQDDRELFLEVVDQTDLSFKHAAYLVENALSCWDDTGDVRRLLDYESFDTPAARTAIDVIEAADSARGALAEFSVDDDRSVAVIGERHLTELDRRALPSEYTAVDPFAPDTFSPPEFRIFPSATAIVDAVVRNVSSETADRVAVVMDRDSQYPPLVESAFEAAGVPYYGGPGFADDERVRSFVRLLRAALTSDGLRVTDLRPVLSHLGISPSMVDDEQRLRDLDDEEVAPVWEFCDSVDSHTLGTALDTYEEWYGRPHPDLRNQLDRLDLADRPVTDETVDALSYYLESYEVPIDREDEGVLLADPRTAAYVDRPVVFLLGLDAGWTNSPPDRPWIDADAWDRRYLERFQILLQNGAEQYYLVQNAEAGETVTPCLYFHDLLDREFEEFEDLPNVSHEVTPRGTHTGFDYEETGVTPTTVEIVSQSTLSTFVNCPRDHFFDQIVETVRRDYFRTGNLYHDFAEYYVNHPDVVEDVGLDAVVEYMLAETRPLVDDVDLNTLETEFRVGVRLLMRYLEERPPEVREYDAYETLDPTNLFTEQFGREVGLSITEQWFENADLGGKGKIDLVHRPNRLVDYKSGRSKTASNVVQNAAIDDFGDTPDFQAPLYLAQHRRVHDDGAIEFEFVHFLDPVDEAVVEGVEAVDLEDAATTVTYYPVSFPEFAARRDAFDELREGVAESNDRRKTLERMGYDAYREFFLANDVPDVEDRDDLLASAFADEFAAYAKDHVGDYKYVEKGCESTLKQLLYLRGENFFAPDLAAFEEFLQDQLDRLNEYRRTAFPVGDPNWDRVDHRDLILADGASGPADDRDTGVSER